MIETLLIANRGEIALRVLRTCREMGLRAVAVYSDADAAQPWVRRADLALRLGVAPAEESYLNGELILALAQGNGADAIHPGYGFLAENAAFSDACAERGVLFVGPPPAAIAAMGDKAGAKRLMEAAGVPVLPGYAGEEQAPATLRREARHIGYPLLVKAVAGGGGRGIRIVARESELAEAVDSARREAEGAFADGRLMLEKYLPAPRHVEFQVLADAHGQVVHLFERECSVQRRHQKIVEEAPSPALDPTLRETMGAAAVRAARAVDYRGAGTVEFLLDGEGGFYFLEMNTRLQVEHPVTELVLGVDLVRLQIEVAQGLPLPFRQEDLRVSGHAIECRLNAEEPARDFLPAVGRLGTVAFPEGPGLRVDAGFASGSEIGPHYDSLLAKLIAWGPTREEALRKARRLLAESFVAGLPTNLAFLQAVLNCPAFVAGRYTTRLLEEAGVALLAGPREPFAPEATELLLAAAALDAHLELARRERREPVGSPWSADGAAAGAPGWVAPPPARSAIHRRYAWAGRSYVVAIQPLPGGGLRVTVDGIVHTLGYLPLADDAGSPRQGLLERSGLRVPIRWEARGAERWISLRGGHARLVSVDPQGEARASRAEEGLLRLMAPLPGKVIRVAVDTGQAVGEGDLLVVVEAMKVEHRITAPFAGTVGRLHFAEGDPVDKDDLLLELEPKGRESDA